MTQQAVRHGLSYANYERFAPFFQAAVTHYPTPVHIDWSSGDLRYSTFMSRFRDALKALRENQHWAQSWLTPEGIVRLNTLEIRPHKTAPNLVTIGDHYQLQQSTAATNVGTLNTELEVSSLVAKYNPDGLLSSLSVAPSAASPELKLATSMDLSRLQDVVQAYAVLCSYLRDMPRFRIPTEYITMEQAVSYTREYDVAVIEEGEDIVLF